MGSSSLEPYPHPPFILKTIGNSIDALLRMSTAFGPDPCPAAGPATVLKEFCCCGSAGDVMFDF